MKHYKELVPSQLNENAFQLIGHDWLLITAEKDGKVNTMTASWGGIGVLWNMNVAYIFIRPQRYTKEFVDSADTFSLTVFNDSLRKQLNYLGKVSGRDEDKISKAGLTLTKHGKTPYFEEAEIVLLCRKLYAQPLTEDSFIDKSIINKMYPEADFHTMYVAEITKVLVDETR